MAARANAAAAARVNRRIWFSFDLVKATAISPNCSSRRYRRRPKPGAQHRRRNDRREARGLSGRSIDRHERRRAMSQPSTEKGRGVPEGGSGSRPAASASAPSSAASPSPTRAVRCWSGRSPTTPPTTSRPPTCEPSCSRPTTASSTPPAAATRRPSRREPAAWKCPAPRSAMRTRRWRSCATRSASSGTRWKPGSRRTRRSSPTPATPTPASTSCPARATCGSRSTASRSPSR